VVVTAGTVWPFRKKSKYDGAVAGPPGPECDQRACSPARSPATSLAATRTLRGRGATLLINSDSPLLRRVLHILDLDGDLPLRGSARAAQEEVDRNGHR
jgi:hypothetical protein